MTAEAGAVRALVGFAEALRDAGVTVGTGQVLSYCRAATGLDLDDGQDLYWAGRACLVCRYEDLVVYDAVFRRYFGGDSGGVRMSVSGQLPPRPADAGAGDLLWRWTRGADQPQAPTGTTASAAEVLRRKRFADCTDAELASLAQLMGRLAPPLRRTRRTQPARRGHRHDLRRTLRRSLRSHGELLHHARRAPRVRPRRVVLLLDVSGSMAGYSRALLQFSHAAARASRRNVEVFCFGTRLTRITLQLRTRDADRALAEAAEAVVDWEGGTRIGESIGAFVRRWGRRGMARGAVVVICSDGLERGDPAVLAAEMAKLARLSHRIVWVNPLKGEPGYEPLARGMNAALPAIDVFVSGRDLSSLETLGSVITQLR